MILEPIIFTISVCYAFIWYVNKDNKYFYPWLQRFGEKSYGIYLIHPFIAFDLAVIIKNCVNLDELSLFFLWLPIYLCTAYYVGILYNRLISVFSKMIGFS